MFGSGALEVAVALVFIFLSVSLLATAVREGLEAFLKMRAMDLERGMRELLDDRSGEGFAKDFFNHPMIASLFAGNYDPSKLKPAGPKRGGRIRSFFSAIYSFFATYDPDDQYMPRADRQNLPAYIPAANFVAALIDLTANGTLGPGGPANVAALITQADVADNTLTEATTANATAQRAFDMAGADSGAAAAAADIATRAAAANLADAPLQQAARDAVRQAATASTALDAARTAAEAAKAAEISAVRNMSLLRARAAAAAERYAVEAEKAAADANPPDEAKTKAATDARSAATTQRQLAATSAGRAAGAPGESLAGLRTLALALPTERLQRAMVSAIDQAEGDLAALKTNLETWFNGTMDRVSGWYKRRTQIVLFIIGIAIAAGFNVDAIYLTSRMSHDGTLRQLVVAEAEKATVADLDTATSVKARADALVNLNLPIGWFASGPECVEKGRSDQNNLPVCRPAWSYLTPQLACTLDGPSPADGTPDCARPLEWFVAKWLGMGAGWLITAFAVLLGAPFWFDVLNKLMVIRATVKPTEKSPNESSEDRQTAKNGIANK
jgi:hypothetical protein